MAIAGLVQISQLLGATNSGIIKSLSFDGTITLESGQTVRINDPNAVYSAGYTAKPEFTADDANPSVTGMFQIFAQITSVLTIDSLQRIPDVCSTLCRRSQMPVFPASRRKD